MSESPIFLRPPGVCEECDRHRRAELDARSPSMWETLTRPRFVLTYQQSRARTWYITALCVVAALTFDSLWAALFVVLACVEVHPARQPTEGRDDG